MAYTIVVKVIVVSLPPFSEALVSSVVFSWGGCGQIRCLTEDVCAASERGFLSFSAAQTP